MAFLQQIRDRTTAGGKGSILLVGLLESWSPLVNGPMPGLVVMGWGQEGNEAYAEHSVGRWWKGETEGQRAEVRWSFKVSCPHDSL